LGIRPLAGIGTITQIESTGRSTLDRVTLGFNYRLPKNRGFMFTNYTLASAKNSSDNPLALPMDSRNPDLDWAPSSQDVRHRVNALVNLNLPKSFRVNFNVNASSGAPYTITTGRDDNHDGVTNDRPAGVGRNSARGSARFELGMRLSRGFGFGTTPAAAAQQRAAAGGNRGGGPGGPGGPGGGPGFAGGPPPALAEGQAGPPPGAGGGPGGGPGGGGFGGPGAQGAQRFNVELYAQAFNLLNRANFVNYSGVMTSPFFLHPTSASQARRIEVGMQFRF
jgi:hypothetical protein